MTVDLAVLKGKSGAPDGAVGPVLRRHLVDVADSALRELFGDAGSGLALLAVGGYGRGEPAFGSDLDLVLVHNGRRDDVSKVADGIWYPLWDAGVALDHSVRTVDEAVSVADTDLKAALGLLDARTVAGDPALAADLLERVRSRWRARASRRLPELGEMVSERARRHGEVAFLLEPDLKEARGGLRDVHALRALAAAWVAESPPERVLAAYRVLLDARGEVRRTSGGRAQDRLLLQDAEPVAQALGYPDSLALARAVADAGRTISWTWDTTWYRVASGLKASKWRGRRPAPSSARRGRRRAGRRGPARAGRRPGRRPGAGAAGRGRGGAGRDPAGSVRRRPAGPRVAADAGALARGGPRRAGGAAGHRPGRRAGARVARPGGAAGTAAA